MFYLTAVGLSESESGLLLTLTLVGDIGISLWLTTTADRLGRRRMLMVGGLLMIFAAVLFAVTTEFWLLLLAATVGVISPSGNEVGPFLPVEQAALAQLVSAQSRTRVLAWYNLTGSLATAMGSLCGGALAGLLQTRGWAEAESYRPLGVGYGALGVVLALMFVCLAPPTEALGPTAAAARLGPHRSRGVRLRRGGLFARGA